MRPGEKGKSTSISISTSTSTRKSKSKSKSGRAKHDTRCAKRNVSAKTQRAVL
jgi:hypothetical protein